MPLSPTERSLALWGALSGLGVAALVTHLRGREAMQALSRPAQPPPAEPAGEGQWVDPGAPARIRALAAPVEQALAWPGLGDYLVAVAFGESRGNSAACKDPCGPGWSRGWFQLRPVTYCYANIGLTNEQFLANEAAQVAVAICHARRLGILYDEPGQTVQWRDTRRGWKFPNWVGASYRDDPETQGNLSAFLRNLDKTGVAQSFAYQPAFPQGLDVPPIHTLYALTSSAVA